MITYDEALARVTAAARRLGAEEVTLDSAHGRFLAAPVLAAVDAPPVDVSAMDGYAVCGTGDAFEILGASYPGTPHEGDIGPGECVRIFTGAAVPAGADRVVVQEIVDRNADRALVRKSPAGPDFIRRRGADFRKGQQLLLAGDRLTPRALVVTAGADLGRVSVGKIPRVRVLATGDELVRPGEAHSRQGMIPESVSQGLAALIATYGGACGPGTMVCDDRKETIAAAQTALSDADVVVVVGGASVGERDFAKSAFAAMGIELSFSGVAMRPGRPIWMGSVGETLVMGLPGNPTSAYVTARLLLAPLVQGLAGGRSADAVRWRSATLGEGLPGCGSRETFTRAVCRDGVVAALPYQDSGAQLTLASADVLLRQAADSGPLLAGDAVQMLAL